MKTALAVLALLCVLAAGCRYESPREGLEVPKVVGMTRRAAEELLASKSLAWRYGKHGKVETKAPQPNVVSSLDDDLVLRQSPRPGRIVLPGSVIRLVTNCMVHGPCL